MIPTCEMLEYANNFFISFSKYAANEPKKILINAKKKNMSSIIGLQVRSLRFQHQITFLLVDIGILLLKLLKKNRLPKLAHICKMLATMRAKEKQRTL